ncbi:MAG: hypothetical protein ACXWXA_08555 [Candidatus Limnocylindrales bacterium]
MRRALVEDERRLQLDRFDAATLRPEPACGGELLSIEIPEGPLDGGAGRLGRRALYEEGPAVKAE